jgi:hypothetical protein
MKNLYIGAFVLLWLGSTSLAQSGDWEVVRGIPAGTTVKVTLRDRPTSGHCVLRKVTDDGLACYSRTSGEQQFAREEIRAIYVGHNGKLAGLALGAGFGALNGAANAPNSPTGGLGRGGNALLGAVLVGTIGMAIGAAVGPFFNGKAIYRSGDDRPKKAKRLPSLEPAKNAISRVSQPTPDAALQESHIPR